MALAINRSIGIFLESVTRGGNIACVPLFAHFIAWYTPDNVILPRLQVFQSCSPDKVPRLQNKAVPFEIPVEPSHKHNSVRQGRMFVGNGDADVQEINAEKHYSTRNTRYQFIRQ